MCTLAPIQLDSQAGAFMTDTTTLTDDPPATDRWDTGPHPWRRFLARVFDNFAIGTVLWFLLGSAAWVISQEASDALIGFTESIYGRLLGGTINLAMMIPIQAAMIGLTGSSPGKWLCGVRVRNRDGSRLGFGAALYRELKVWLIGFGAGLPLINLFALVQAYNAVKDSGTADWDDAHERAVACLPATGGRQVLIGLAIVVPVLIWGWDLFERLGALSGQG